MVETSGTYYLGALSAGLIAFVILVILITIKRKSSIYVDVLKFFGVYTLAFFVVNSILLLLSHEGTLEDDGYFGFLVTLVPFLVSLFYLLILTSFDEQDEMITYIEKQSEKLVAGDFTKNFQFGTFNRGRLNRIYKNNEALRVNLQSMIDEILDLNSSIRMLKNSIGGDASDLRKFTKDAKQIIGLLEDSFETQKYSLELLGSDAEPKSLYDAVAFLEKESVKLNKLADQTKIVAINASIEASQSENYTGGFNIVADNVRDLSVRSTDSASALMQNMRDMKVDLTSRMNSIQDRTSNILANSENIASLIYEIVSQLSLENNTVSRLENDVEKLFTYVENLEEELGKFVKRHQI